MNFLAVIKYWKYGLIVALLVFSLLAVRSCNSARDDLATLKAQDQALAQQAQKESDEKQRQDKQHYDEAKETYEKQIQQLANDHTVASIPKCVRNANPKSSPLPTPTSPAQGAIANNAADFPQPVADDLGPAIDALTRECDALAVRHSALVQWILDTR